MYSGVPDTIGQYPLTGVLPEPTIHPIQISASGGGGRLVGVVQSESVCPYNHVLAAASTEIALLALVRRGGRAHRVASDVELLACPSSAPRGRLAAEVAWATVVGASGHAGPSVGDELLTGVHTSRLEAVASRTVAIRVTSCPGERAGRVGTEAVVADS